MNFLMIHFIKLCMHVSKLCQAIFIAHYSQFDLPLVVKSMHVVCFEWCDTVIHPHHQINFLSKANQSVRGSHLPDIPLCNRPSVVSWLTIRYRFMHILKLRGPLKQLVLMSPSNSLWLHILPLLRTLTEFLLSFFRSFFILYFDFFKGATACPVIL